MLYGEIKCLLKKLGCNSSADTDESFQMQKATALLCKPLLSLALKLKLLKLSLSFKQRNLDKEK